jgi:hypothetical protein
VVGRGCGGGNTAAVALACLDNLPHGGFAVHVVSTTRAPASLVPGEHVPGEAVVVGAVVLVVPYAVSVSLLEFDSVVGGETE